MIEGIVKLEFFSEAQDHGEGILRITYEDGRISQYQCTRAVADAFAEELRQYDK